MPLLVNNNDLRKARKTTEIALSRYRVADEPRNELISVSDIEELTGPVVRAAVEGAVNAKGRDNQAELQVTPQSVIYRGPSKLVPWIIAGVAIAWALLRR